MGLSTPEKIRDFQRKLYEKAKREPTFRFYSLYDKIYRADILAHGFRLAKENKGAPGVDGETFDKVEAEGLENWLGKLGEELREERYTPLPVRRVMIPKPNGGERPLGIPAIRDRVVQTAAKLVLEPIFEADFEKGMYGYRPNRSAQGAVEEAIGALRNGQTDVVDADLSKYFDTIPHEDLLKAVARRICDGKVMHLIKLWLKTPVEEKDKDGKTRMTGGKGSKMGTPQGGVMSPLLANIYMNRFMRAWRERGEDRRLQATVVNYADDFVILSRGKAARALERTRQWMGSLKLTLNETKTRLCQAWKVKFDFLGYTFGPLVYVPTGGRYLGARPSDKSLSRLREKLREILSPGNQQSWGETTERVNRLTRGWANYFSVGTIARSYWKISAFLLHRVRRFLVRRHKVPGRGTRRFPAEWIFGSGGIRPLTGRRGHVPVHASA